MCVFDAMTAKLLLLGACGAVAEWVPIEFFLDKKDTIHSFAFNAVQHPFHK